MTFDNSKTIISVRIRLFTATVLFLAFIILTFPAHIIKYPLLGMNETVWTVILAICYVIFLFYPMLLNYQYIYYSDDGENIVFRYFNSGIAGGKKNSVEIPKNIFSGYRIEKRSFGLNISLILYQRMQEGVAKYPPIYITSLTREEKAKIKRSLNSYAAEIY